MAPRIKAIRLTGGISGDSATNEENILKGVLKMRDIVGQMPKIVKAKKSVAGFKLRKGADLLLLVTIRQKNVLSSFLNLLIFTGCHLSSSIGGRGPGALTGTGHPALLYNHIYLGLSGPLGFGVNIYLTRATGGDFYKSQLLF
jgi:large subunit ribosomal protein L5